MTQCVPVHTKLRLLLRHSPMLARRAVNCQVLAEPGGALLDLETEGALESLVGSDGSTTGSLYAAPPQPTQVCSVYAPAPHAPSVIAICAARARHNGYSPFIGQDLIEYVFIYIEFSYLS